MDREVTDRLRIKLGKYREAEANGRFAIVALVIVVLAVAGVIFARALT